MLISSCAVVERTVTECGGKLKALGVKQKSFELGRKGGKFFQADRKRGQMKYTLRCALRKIEQRIRISARKRPRDTGLSEQLCPALTSSVESCDKHLKTPQINDEMGQMDDRNQAR